MKTPFPARFAFATNYPVAARDVPAQPATVKGVPLRVALLGVSVFALAAAAMVVA